MPFQKLPAIQMYPLQEALVPINRISPHTVGLSSNYVLYIRPIYIYGSFAAFMLVYLVVQLIVNISTPFVTTYVRDPFFSTVSSTLCPGYTKVLNG